MYMFCVILKSRFSSFCFFPMIKITTNLCVTPSHLMCHCINQDLITPATPTISVAYTTCFFAHSVWWVLVAPLHLTIMPCIPHAFNITTASERTDRCGIMAHAISTYSHLTKTSHTTPGSCEGGWEMWMGTWLFGQWCLWPVICDFFPPSFCHPALPPLTFYSSHPFFQG